VAAADSAAAHREDGRLQRPESSRLESRGWLLAGVKYAAASVSGCWIWNVSNAIKTKHPQKLFNAGTVTFAPLFIQR
jgi:hypothetical protein